MHEVEVRAVSDAVKDWMRSHLANLVPTHMGNAQSGSKSANCPAEDVKTGVRAPFLRNSEQGLHAHAHTEEWLSKRDYLGNHPGKVSRNEVFHRVGRGANPWKNDARRPANDCLIVGDDSVEPGVGHGMHDAPEVSRSVINDCDCVRGAHGSLLRAGGEWLARTIRWTAPNG